MLAAEKQALKVASKVVQDCVRLLKSSSKVNELFNQHEIQQILMVTETIEDTAFRLTCEAVKDLWHDKYEASIRKMYQAYTEHSKATRDHAHTTYTARYESFTEFALSLNIGGIESMIGRAIEAVVSKASKDAADDGESTRRGSMLGKRPLRLFEFMTGVGKTVMSVERLEKESFEIRIYYDLILCQKYLEVGTVEYLNKLTYKDLREKIEHKIKYSFVFANLPDENAFIRPDSNTKSIYLHIARIEPVIIDFDKYYEAARVDGIIISKFSYGDRSIHFATFTIFKEIINFKSCLKFLNQMLQLKDNDADMAKIIERMKTSFKLGLINEYKLDCCLANTDMNEEIIKFDVSKKTTSYLDTEATLKSITDIDDFKYSELQPTIIAVRDSCTAEDTIAAELLMNLHGHLLPSFDLKGIKYDYVLIGCSGNALPFCENEYVSYRDVPPVPSLSNQVVRESIMYYELDDLAAANED